MQPTVQYLNSQSEHTCLEVEHCLIYSSTLSPSLRSLHRRRSVTIDFFFFFVFCLFRASPVAHGGSQARGLIRAVAASLPRATATPDLSCVCDLHHSSWQCWILNPLSKARDRTCNPMVPSRICFCCTMMGTLIY